MHIRINNERIRMFSCQNNSNYEKRKKDSADHNFSVSNTFLNTKEDQSVFK
jgi:hypothetical protein